MPVVAGDRQAGELGVADGDAGRVGVGVEFGVHAQPGTGSGRGDRVDDDLVAGQWLTAPVHGDVGRQVVLDGFHLEVPGGKWQTVILRSRPSSAFQALARQLLEPPESPR